MTLKQNVKNKNDWIDTINTDKKSKKIYYHKFDKDKQIIVPMGDIHYKTPQTDMDTVKSILDWGVENDAKFILMGDILETATRESVGAGVYEQSEIVQTQLEDMVKLFKPVAEEGCILGSHVGNHENRVYNSSGLNLSKIFATMIDVPYLGIGAAWMFRVGKETYTAYTTHGHSGARMPHTKIATVIKQNQMINTEIYIHAHLHQLSHHVQNYYEVNKRNKTIEEAQKHYLLTGSFLKHWGGYAQIAGYEPARIGCPKVKLSGLEHRIRISL
jgi:hypothetical protein